MTDRTETLIDEWMDAHGMDDMGLEARDLIDRLAAARIAIVELPEPDDDHRDGIAFWTAQDVGVHGDAVVTRFDPGSEAIYFNPEVARATGLAMLAAADAAEASQ